MRRMKGSICMSRSTQPSTPAPAHETSLESLLQELRIREGGQGNLFGASIGSALEAIRANRTRSLLTMLGIVIGITAVIGALTLTKGVGAYIDNVLLGQGANTIYVAPSHSLVQQGGSTVSQEGQPLTVHDLQSLSNLPHVAAIRTGERISRGLARICRRSRAGNWPQVSGSAQPNRQEESLSQSSATRWRKTSSLLLAPTRSARE